MIPALACLLLGIALGSRFKVTILFAAIPLFLALTFIDDLAHRSGFWPTVLSAVVGSTSLQIGYMLGLFLRCAIVGDDPRVSRERALRRTAPTP
jgi:hypothetical protein